MIRTVIWSVAVAVGLLAWPWLLAGLQRWRPAWLTGAPVADLPTLRDGLDRPGLGQPVATQHGILQDGHVIKKLDLLESSGQTYAVNRVGRTFSNIVTVEFDCSLAKRIDAGNEVEQRGFPGAVRTD